MASRRYEIGVGLLLAVSFVVLAWMALQVGAFEAPGDRVRLTTELRDASGLQVGSSVALAGVEVGKVTGLSLKEGRALVEFAVDRSAGLRDSDQVSVRAKSLLGEKFLSVERGPGGEAVVAGQALAVKHERVEIDDLVNVLGPLLEGLDMQALNGSLATLSEALAEDPERLKRMLDNADVILANTSEASAELPALAREARAAVAEGRGVLSELEARTIEARGAIARADEALAQVGEATQEAPALIAEAKAAVGDARAAMSRLEASTGKVEQILQNLSEIDKDYLYHLLREEGIRVRLNDPKKKKGASDTEPDPG